VSLVVDASVAVKWFLKDRPDEQHADLALQILERSACGQLPMIQPPHFMAEVAAVLVRLKPAGAHVDLLDLFDISYRTLASPSIYLNALDLARRYQHHLFDTLYHAVALHTPGAMLVTADERYYNKVRLEGQITLLANFKLQG
jgi:predicted nucleic acid-binding protein